MRTLEDFQKLEKLLAVFHQGMLQNFFTFLALLEKENVSLEDVKWYLNQLKERERVAQLHQIEQGERTRKANKEQEEWRKRGRCCPLCGTFLSLDRITAPRGNANVYGYRGVWECPREDCLFEEFTLEYPEAIYDKLMGR